MKPTLEEFLDWRIDILGWAPVVKMVMSQLDIAALRAGQPRDPFTQHLYNGCSWKTLRRTKKLSKAAVTPKKRDRELSRLAALLRSAGTDLGDLVTPAPKPWNTIPIGSQVVVFVGEQVFQCKRTKAAKIAISRHDKQALGVFIRFLNSLGLGLQAVIPEDPPPTTIRKATAEVNRHLKSPHVGAVFSLGSPLVNPYTAAIAPLALDDQNAADSPAKFRFSSRVTPPDHFLCDNRWQHGQPVGISVRHQQGVIAERDTEDTVKRRVNQGITDGFRDAGLLVLDNRNKKLLGFCAGHGGLATEACVCALNRTVYLARRLAWNDPILGTGRTLEIVHVEGDFPHDLQDLGAYIGAYCDLLTFKDSHVKMDDECDNDEDSELSDEDDQDGEN